VYCRRVVCCHRKDWTRGGGVRHHRSRSTSSTSRIVFEMEAASTTVPVPYRNN
jgi:hypothetical protein